jgi:uncharacterized protein
MRFSELTFILTEDCNWRCSYCYQERGKRVLDKSLLAEACAFFFPHLDQKCVITFYGGEPFLAFDRIAQVVEDFRKKNRGREKELRFSLTTNGSLISDETLAFLNENSFELLLSFDGLAQDRERKNGTMKKTKVVLEKLLGSPKIKVGTNSVFTPETVGFLSSSLKYLAEMGVPDILMSVSLNSTWSRAALLSYGKELRQTGLWLAEFYARKRKVPLASFRETESDGIFACRAGRDRMALAADGTLWGCYLVADYFAGRSRSPESADYCFGSFGDFSGKARSIYVGILKNYARWRMDRCSTGKTFCPLCPQFSQCRICPMTVGLSGGTIGMIPEFLCRTNKVLFKERELFWSAVNETRS